MTKRTKKAGIVEKYDTRYSGSLRKQIKRMEVIQPSKFFCEFCGKFAVKRKAVRIWGCKDYGKVKCGGAYTVMEHSNWPIRRLHRNDYLESYLKETSRYGKKTEVPELGMQEIRTYFRLFLLSSVLFMFMFCSRISKSKSNRPVVLAIPL